MHNDDQPGVLTDEMVLWYVRQGLTPRALESAYSRRCGLREKLAETNGCEDDIPRLAERWGIKRNGERT